MGFRICSPADFIMKSDERRVYIMGFWKKTGIGACIGLAFGATAAAGFIGMKAVTQKIFPDKSGVTAKIEAEVETDSKDSDKAKAGTDTIDREVKNASLTMAVAGEGSSKASGAGMSVTELAKENIPCVVSITNSSVQVIRDMWGNSMPFDNVSRGSGIIVGQTDEELLIVTNAHVVKDAETITVGFVDSEIYDATVKGADNEIDLAVIGIQKSELKQDTLDAIKIAVIGDSDALEVGEQVVAIGNAMGYGQSVTTGIVSALERDVPDDQTETAYIQTDAAINPGNSGGALLNMNGEVIGINSAKIASAYVEGMGYAIPMKIANPTIETLMNRKSRDKVDEEKAGYLGITGVSVDSQTSKMYGIPEGIYLQEVIEDGPADKAGLLKGDIIKKFDGVSVSSIAELREKMDYYEAGEKVDVVFCRQEDGEYVDKTVSVTLTTKSDVGFKDEDKGKGDDDADKDGSVDKDKDKKEDKNNDKEQKDKDGEKDYFNSLPDELKEFFFGFGR